MLDVFVTGSENSYGKALVTAGIAATMQSLGYSTGVYKPVHAGSFQRNGKLAVPDLLYVKHVDNNVKTYYSYLFKNKDLPMVAAAKEGVTISFDKIFEDYTSVREKFDCFFVCGTDGIATPINGNLLEIDLARLLNLPLLFVISPFISNLNDILIMINHASVRSVKISGVILFDCPYRTNDENIKNLPKLIERYTDTRVVGAFPQIKSLANLNPNDLISYVLSGVNLENLFNAKIAKLSV